MRGEKIEGEEKGVWKKRDHTTYIKDRYYIEEIPEEEQRKRIKMGWAFLGLEQPFARMGGM